MQPTIPAAVRRGVRRTLGTSGIDAPIASVERVGGGCINPSARIELESGEAFFLKWNRERPGLFPPEARGLRALADAGPLRVPEVIGVDGGSAGDPGWLLLEFVPEGPAGDGYGTALGHGLAELHRTGDGAWGWEEDNFIGPLPQSNRSAEEWAGFWVDERLRPQLRRARERGFFRDGRTAWEDLFRGMEELVRPAAEEGASLLHGDLWSGNVYPGPRGEAVLVDPAVYRGHREVDLAMSELFGGFPPDFRAAYRDAWPLAPGYRRARRAVYQLYPLLVHVNLFGRGYVERTRRALREALSARGGS